MGDLFTVPTKKIGRLIHLRGRHTLPLNLSKAEYIIFDYDADSVLVSLDWPEGFHDRIYDLESFPEYLKKLICDDLKRSEELKKIAESRREKWRAS
jgi:hypothetical protein